MSLKQDSEANSHEAKRACPQRSVFLECILVGCLVLGSACSSTSQSLLVIEGDGQKGLPGAPVPLPLRVQVLDSAGKALDGSVVVFTVGATVTSVATTAGGFAALTGSTFSTIVGSEAATAQLSGSSLVAIFRLTTQAGPSAPVAVDISAAGGIYPLEVPGLGQVKVTIPPSGDSTVSRLEIAMAEIPTLETPDAEVSAHFQIRSDYVSPSGLPLRVRIPDRRLPDEMTAPYWFDPASGTLDPVAVVAEDDSSITIAAPSLEWKAFGTGLQRGLLPSHILMLHVQNFRNPKFAKSDFLPGTDDWAFANVGTAPTPEGQCTGQSLSARHHFLVRKANLALPELHHQGPTLLTPALKGYEDARGVRFAAAVQAHARDLAVRKAFEDAYTAEVGTHVFATPDFMNFVRLVDALRRTGAPQLIALWAGPKDGHAVLAYAANPAAGEVSIADPNYPGAQRTLPFSDQLYQPFPSSLRADSPAQTYPHVSFVPMSSLGPGFARSLSTEWNAWTLGVAGDDLFPFYLLRIGFDARDYQPAMTVYDDQLLIAGSTLAGPLQVLLYASDGGALPGPRVTLIPDEDTVVYARLSDLAAFDGGRPDFIDFQKIAVKHGGYRVIQADGSPLPATLDFAPGKPQAFLLVGKDGSQTRSLDYSLAVGTLSGPAPITAGFTAAPSGFQVALSGTASESQSSLLSFTYRGKPVGSTTVRLVDNRCDSVQVAGGDLAESRTVEMGARSGTFTFRYDSQTVQDRLRVTYDGSVLFDTGCVGASATRVISFAGNSTRVRVDVEPNCAGGTNTAWSFSVGCPL